MQSSAFDKFGIILFIEFSDPMQYIAERMIRYTIFTISRKPGTLTLSLQYNIA